MAYVWGIAGVSLLVAAVSWMRAREAARRLERMSQMYWELKYEVSELRVQLQRVTGPAADPPPSRPDPAPDGYVSLASLKKR